MQTKNSIRLARRMHHNKVQNPSYAPDIHRARFQGLTVPVLKRLAVSAGLVLASKATKAEVVDALVSCKVRGPVAA